MATIVVHRTTGQRFVLIGTGYAATESATPGLFLGNLDPDVQTKIYGRLAVSDSAGNILWVDSREFVVAEVDGFAPPQLIDGPSRP
jgi:hypothetical protein